MVGSEPSEYGWYFKDWIQALADDPSINGAKIGKVICDSNMRIYKEFKGGVPAEIQSFSVIDLSKMSELRQAHKEFFDAAVKNAKNSAGFKGAFARAAESRNSENFSDRYTDLGLLAKNTKSVMPEESKKLLSAIDKAVIYNKRGSSLKSGGISTYYPYLTDKNQDSSAGDTPGWKIDFKEFLNQDSTPQSQKDFYIELLSSNLSNPSALEGTKLRYNSEDHIVAKVAPERLENVSNIDLMVIPLLKNGDIDFGLTETGGVVSFSDEDLKVDWKKGIVTENFRALQPTFDGHKIFMIPKKHSRGKNFYSVPIILNSRKAVGRCHLTVSYDTSKKAYSIIGVDADVENGIISKIPLKLESGDIITPIFLAVISEKDADSNTGKYTDPKTGKSVFYKLTTGEPFVYTYESKITAEPINRGYFLAFFRFEAPNGQSTVSWPFFMSAEHGKIERYIPDEDDLNQK